MRRVLTVIGVIVIVLVLVVVAAFVFVTLRADAKLTIQYDVPEVADIDIPTGDEALVEGERLYVTRGCSSCHLDSGEGQVMIDDPALGRVVSTNLTSGEGGVAGNYESSGEWLRALRHGVDENGETFLLMPSHHFNHYSDADMGLIIGYVQQLEPVDNVLPEQSLGPVGRTLILAESTNDLLPGALIDHENIDVWNDVEPGATVEYGHYMARGNCAGCHSENLSGGAIPGEELPSSNITFDESGLEGWTLEEFQTAMQNGVRPDGSAIDPAMPWNIYGQLTDDEIEALYLYLESIEPLPYDTAVTEENTILNR